MPLEDPLRWYVDEQLISPRMRDFWGHLSRSIPPAWLETGTKWLGGATETVGCLCTIHAPPRGGATTPFCRRCMLNLVFRGGGGPADFCYERIRETVTEWKDAYHEFVKEEVVLIDRVAANLKPLGCAAMLPINTDHGNWIVDELEDCELPFADAINEWGVRVITFCRDPDLLLGQVTDMRVVAEIYVQAVRYMRLVGTECTVTERDVRSAVRRAATTPVGAFLHGFDWDRVNPVLGRVPFLFETGLVLGYPPWSTVGLFLEWGRLTKEN